MSIEIISSIKPNPKCPLCHREAPIYSEKYWRGDSIVEFRCYECDRRVIIIVAHPHFRYEVVRHIGYLNASDHLEDRKIF